MYLKICPIVISFDMQTRTFYSMTVVISTMITFYGKRIFRPEIRYTKEIIQSLFFENHILVPFLRVT